MLRWTDRLTTQDTDAMQQVLAQAVQHGLVREDWQVYAPDGQRRWLLTLLGGAGPTSERAYTTREAMALCLGLAAGIERLEVLQTQHGQEVTRLAEQQAKNAGADMAARQRTSQEADVAYRRRMGDPDARPQGCTFEAQGLACGCPDHGGPYHVQGGQVWLPSEDRWVTGTLVRGPRGGAQVRRDPWLSPTQRRRVADLVRTDPRAMLLGFDEKRRPVVACRSGIPREWRVWAMLRNGDPADPTGRVAPSQEVVRGG